MNVLKRLTTIVILNHEAHEQTHEQVNTAAAWTKNCQFHWDHIVCTIKGSTTKICDFLPVFDIPLFCYGTLAYIAG